MVFLSGYRSLQLLFEKMHSLVRLGRSSCTKACISRINKLFASTSRRASYVLTCKECTYTGLPLMSTFSQRPFCSFSTDAKTVRQKDAVQNHQLKAFDDTFPIIIEDMTKYFASRNLQDVDKWFSEVLRYNVPHGKRNRGMGVISSYAILVNDASSEQLHVARIVGWCLEMIQACFLVSDDIVDQSVTRRGQPCWYKKDNVGMMAVNDTIMLHSSIFQILPMHIKNKDCLSEIQKCFQDVIFLTSAGQCLDLLSEQKKRPLDLKKYTYDLYFAVVQYKTSYYSFCLPVHLALVLAGLQRSYTSSVDELMLTIGQFFQIQDDYLDCFGDPAITGKVGTDIENGKCCWPIVTALSRVNSEDRDILQANYGVPDAKSSQRIRDLYHRIGLKDLYSQYEGETYKKICQQIEDVSKTSNIPQELFYNIFNSFYKRNK